MSHITRYKAQNEKGTRARRSNSVCVYVYVSCTRIVEGLTSFKKRSRCLQKLKTRRERERESPPLSKQQTYNSEMGVSAREAEKRARKPCRERERESIDRRLDGNDDDDDEDDDGQTGRQAGREA